MDIKQLILNKLRKREFVTTAEIVKITGFSRQFISLALKALKEEGGVVLVGKANQAKYILTDKKKLREAKSKITAINLTLRNKELSEDLVLDKIKKETGIFNVLENNVGTIIDYGFTEILNNAIEHSRSEIIKLKIMKENGLIKFEIVDVGIGIFHKIMKQKHLSSETEAIQDLLKGKQTTNPAEHSGEGIFFTSKAADMLTIESSKKKLIFNNLIEDIFISDIKNRKGTRVVFSIAENSKKNLENIFRGFTGGFLEFSKTRVKVLLYKMGGEHISRSQARRIIFGLDKFKEIILDFTGVKSVGQAFVDEIFRAWQNNHKNIKIAAEHTNENVSFMISRVRAAS